VNRGVVPNCKGKGVLPGGKGVTVIGGRGGSLQRPQRTRHGGMGALARWRGIRFREKKGVERVQQGGSHEYFPKRGVDGWGKRKNAGGLFCFLNNSF